MPKIKEFIASKIPLEALLAAAPSASSSGNGSGSRGGGAAEDVVMDAPVGEESRSNGMVVDGASSAVSTTA